METYWKLDDPYWHTAAPYTHPIFPLYEEAPSQANPPFGLTQRTGMVALGMVGIGLVLGILVGYATSSGKHESATLVHN